MLIVVVFGFVFGAGAGSLDGRNPDGRDDFLYT